MHHHTHFILVDFQNVTKLDLDRLMVPEVAVLLFLGENQKKLPASLVKQIITHPAEVRLIKVGETTPNALDRRLTGYLAHLCPQHPEAHFAILSRDKDFDLLISYLVETGVRIARYDAFDELPIVAARKGGASKMPFAAVKAVKDQVPPVLGQLSLSPVVVKPDPAEEKMRRLVKHLLTARPPTRETLGNAIKHHFHDVLPKGGLKGVIAALKLRGILSLDDSGKVTYLGIS